MVKVRLRVDNLSVEVEGKRVVRRVSLEVGEGEVGVIAGSNGSGKSSLVSSLVGVSGYKVIGGRVRLEEKNLLEMSVDERARAGLFVAHQTPVEIPGVKVFTLCKTAYEVRGNKIESVVELKRKLEKMAKRVGLLSEHVGRSVNEGFSGGEKKRLELLQLLLLSPKVAILDEVDSGLDAKGREMVVEIVRELRAKGTSFLVITHYDKFAEQLEAERVWEMKDGRLQTG